MSKGQEELREKIASYSYDQWEYFRRGRNGDGWDKEGVGVKEIWYGFADKILSIITDKCWLKDEKQGIPQEGGLAWAFWHEGWRPVKGIVKED